MVNKKGLVRIIEAMIAILIILGALLLISSQREIRVKEDLAKLIPPILEEIAKTQSLREKISSDYNLSRSYTDPGNADIISELEDFVDRKITNEGIDFAVRICGLRMLCPLEPYPVENPGDIFASERVISATIKGGDFSPKKVKIFLWKKF